MYVRQEARYLYHMDTACQTSAIRPQQALLCLISQLPIGLVLH